MALKRIEAIQNQGQDRVLPGKPARLEVKTQPLSEEDQKAQKVLTAQKFQEAKKWLLEPRKLFGK